MRFVRNLRDNQIEFFVEESTETDATVRVVLPPYGSYSRGELYTSQELNNLIKEEIKDLISIDNNGRFLALQENYKSINLNFKKHVKTPAVKAPAVEIIAQPPSINIPTTKKTKVKSKPTRIRNNKR